MEYKFVVMNSDGPLCICNTEEEADRQVTAEKVAERDVATIIFGAVKKDKINQYLQTANIHKRKVAVKGGV